MSQSSTKPPVWFYIVAALALLWNLMGVMVFIAQVTTSPDALAAMPENERTLYENFPLWALIAFAAAVFGGAAGCILLLLRKSLATTIFMVSLAGIVVQMIYNLFVSGAMDVYGPGAIAMPIMILIIGVVLIWFSKFATKSGWIG